LFCRWRSCLARSFTAAILPFSAGCVSPGRSCCSLSSACRFFSCAFVTVFVLLPDPFVSALLPFLHVLPFCSLPLFTVFFVASFLYAPLATCRSLPPFANNRSFSATCLRCASSVYAPRSFLPACTALLGAAHYLRVCRLLHIFVLPAACAHCLPFCLYRYLPTWITLPLPLHTYLPACYLPRFSFPLHLPGVRSGCGTLLQTLCLNTAVSPAVDSACYLGFLGFRLRGQRVANAHNIAYLLLGWISAPRLDLHYSPPAPAAPVLVSRRISRSTVKRSRWVSRSAALSPAPACLPAATSRSACRLHTVCLPSFCLGFCLLLQRFAPALPGLCCVLLRIAPACRFLPFCTCLLPPGSYWFLSLPLRSGSFLRFYGFSSFSATFVGTQVLGIRFLVWVCSFFLLLCSLHVLWVCWVYFFCLPFVSAFPAFSAFLRLCTGPFPTFLDPLVSTWTLDFFSGFF